MPRLDEKNLFELAKASGRAALSPSTSYTIGKETLNAQVIQQTFQEELNELGKTTYEYQKNAPLIFELMSVALNEVLPKSVLSAYGQFADVITVAQGTTPVFTTRISEASKKRAKQFVTKVGLAGRYETFKLDGYKFEIPTSAIGGAARVEWEEMLDGRFTMADYYNIVLEALDEAIYREIAKSLIATVDSIQAVNKVVANGFVESAFDQLLQTADAYGNSTIYCTFEFAATMLPDKDWVSNEMKDTLWNNGYFTTYKKHKVVVLPQSFEDSTNTTKVIDPSYAFIIPTGSEKPVKVAFEGAAQVKSFGNRDWSEEIETYQKVGVSTYLVNPGICVYQNQSLSIENTPYNDTSI